MVYGACVLFYSAKTILCCCSMFNAQSSNRKEWTGGGGKVEETNKIWDGGLETGILCGVIHIICFDDCPIKSMCCLVFGWLTVRILSEYNLLYRMAQTTFKPSAPPKHMMNTEYNGIKYFHVTLVTMIHGGFSHKQQKMWCCILVAQRSYAAFGPANIYYMHSMPSQQFVLCFLLNRVDVFFSSMITFYWFRFKSSSFFSNTAQN